MAATKKAQRPIWTGAVSFGLVNVPVRLFSATSPREVHFHMLHDKDGGRIHLKRVCAVDGDEVPYAHIVKGYEVRKGRFVTVTSEELEAFTPKATKNIEIEDFVDLAQIDPIYYQTTYYLVPDRGAGRAYQLLREAMETTGKVGIARMVLRTRQSLCAVRPMGKALAVSTMLFADEVVDLGELSGLPDAKEKPRDKELKMAEQLVQSLAAPFKIEQYRDDYREQVLDLIAKKGEGADIVAAQDEEPGGKVVSLMEALQASLSAKAASPGRGARSQAGSASTRARRNEPAHRRKLARPRRA
ncbi:MAG: Ku protein [Myxococcales bacterium]